MINFFQFPIPLPVFTYEKPVRDLENFNLPPNLDIMLTTLAEREGCSKLAVLNRLIKEELEVSNC